MSHQPLEHTADLGIEVRAATLDALFADAAAGLYDTILELAEIAPTRQGELRVEAAALDLLLVEWLEELLFRLDAQGELWLRCSVQVSEGAGGRWTAGARCDGERLVPGRHALKVQVKAITYHELEVARTEEGWCARVIFDI
jgi:SHS2 domain-containing protein